MIASHSPLLLLILLLVVVALNTTAFLLENNSIRLPSTKFKNEYSPLRAHGNDGQEEKSAALLSRRQIVAGALLCAGSSALVASPEKSFGAAASNEFRSATRPTAYLVDSTIPPTLIPLNAARENVVLSNLGKGSGTDKEAVFIDKLNLNNMANKAIFGTADAISSLIGGANDDSRSGQGYASFVCLGMPSQLESTDMELAESLFSSMAKARKGKGSSSALGLHFCPFSAQPLLDAYTARNADDSALLQGLIEAGVPEEVGKLHMNLMRLALRESWSLLAMSPEYPDIEMARKQGLQNVNSERRNEYVADADGFIQFSADPKFRLYTDRSLFKDYRPLDGKDQPGDFFAERILVHEAGATAVARYASSRPESFVVLTAPIPDLRFMNGINGRIPRLCRFFNPASKVTDNAVTTILLNPTAKETLSLTRYLRLEIGTGPDTLQYQTKVADYLWFSSSPKVNMIPRLMEY